MQYTAPNHGNSGAAKLFFVIKRSTLQIFKKQVSQTGKRVISVLYDNKTQMQNEDRDYSDLPRSKKQLIDLPRSSLMNNEVRDILAYNKELNNDATLWHHSDIPDDLWVTENENIVVEMSNGITLPISVDPTFNFGAYDITPLTYRIALFQCKSQNLSKKWVPATVVRPAIVYQNKSPNTYELAMR